MRNAYGPNGAIRPVRWPRPSNADHYLLVGVCLAPLAVVTAVWVYFTLH